jgi:putative endonuclease
MNLTADMLQPEPSTSTWGLHGVRAAASMEQARCSRRPARLVLFDERRRIGGRPGRPGRSSAGGSSGTYPSGLFGEEVVADRLVDDGWKLLGHRVKTRVGEIDLVARRGDTVVFAEVKTAGPGRIGVEQAVDGRQRHRIRRAAIAWMACNPALQRGVRRYRFDVFLVRRDRDGVVERVEHIPDAF